jgi:hypothetical protein
MAAPRYGNSLNFEKVGRGLRLVAFRIKGLG